MQIYITVRILGGVCVCWCVGGCVFAFKSDQRASFSPVIFTVLGFLSNIIMCVQSPKPLAPPPLPRGSLWLAVVVDEAPPPDPPWTKHPSSAVVPPRPRHWSTGSSDFETFWKHDVAPGGHMTQVKRLQSQSEVCCAVPSHPGKTHRRVNHSQCIRDNVTNIILLLQTLWKKKNVFNYFWPNF